MSACPACSSENPDVARFCIHCGASLTAVCPSCGATAPPGARFCMECGSALATTTEEPSLAALAAAGEKKHITVLFADVAGSMDLQERLDAEVWAQIMGRFVAILAEGVRKYGGTVDKFTGDGIMALFGAPVAQEDHARRACHAAWHLTKTIGEYSDELRQMHDLELQVRLGLNSGEVVVGRVGDDMTLDPTALGHTVGLAQRMEAMAEPGRAYLSQYTARLVEGWFQLDDLGSTSVKGSREPLRIHVLEGPTATPPVLRGSGALGVAPLVGRERELAVLEDALASASEGHAQVVGIVGEAGVGKSRLCDEFAQACLGRRMAVRRTTAVSHAQDVPLLPILALLRDYFSIVPTDEPVEARQKITRRLLDLDPELDEALPLVFDFLEVPDLDRPAPGLAPEVRIRRIFQVLRRVTARRSEQETLVLLLEDLHWFDPSSQAFLEQLIPSFPGSRTLVVTNFRPEFIPPWAAHSYYRQLPLAPLDVDSAGRLLHQLLGGDPSLAPLTEQIVERTGGTPFFMEEVVRSLTEDGTLAGEPGRYRLREPLHDLRVPATVQATLAARIDRLDESDRQLLLAAAVIGRTFTQPVLRLVVDQPEHDVARSLANLCLAEFLQPMSLEAEEAYRFWHPLTQEVAYQGLLRPECTRHHRAVAQAVIATASDRLDEQAALIAFHFEQAGEQLEAARWSLRAGTWALRSDLAEAHRRWRGALDLLKTSGESPEALEVQVQIQIKLIQFGGRVGIDPAEVERLYEDGLAVAQRLDDLRLQTMLVYVSGSATNLVGDVPNALAGYLHAASMGVPLDDPALQSALANAPALTMGWTGPLDEALVWANRAFESLSGDPTQGTDLVGYSLLMRAFTFRAMALNRMGRLHDAAADAEHALAIGHSRAEHENLVMTIAVACEAAWLRGAHDDCNLALAREAVQVGEDTGNVMALVFGLDALTLAHLTVDQPSEAIAAAQRALTEARTRRVALFLEAEILANLARAQLAHDDLAAAAHTAEEAVAIARQRGTRVFECLALLTRAQTHRLAGDTDLALAGLDGALALIHDTGARTYEPFIHEELGRLHDDENKLRDALRLYRQIGATGHAQRLETELAANSAG